MDEETLDKTFMRAALEEAKKGAGLTHPNPAVGAVIASAGSEVARGHHKKSGGPHAERAALDQINLLYSAPRTLYVTLEPCSTQGRTGACTDLILKSGITRVVVGTLDPNPAHFGRGVDLLRRAGIQVKTGVLETECRELNPEYNYRMTSQTS